MCSIFYHIIYATSTFVTTASMTINLPSCLFLALLIPFLALNFYNCFWFIGKVFVLSCNILPAWSIFTWLVLNGWCNLNCIYSYFTCSAFFHGLNFWDQWHLCVCLGVRFFHNYLVLISSSNFTWFDFFH